MKKLLFFVMLSIVWTSSYGQSAADVSAKSDTVQTQKFKTFVDENGFKEFTLEELDQMADVLEKSSGKVCCHVCGFNGRCKYRELTASTCKSLGGSEASSDKCS